MTDPVAFPSKSPSTAIAVWPPEVLARHLVSADPAARTLALGMAVQSGAPINQCVDELVRSVALCLCDPLPSQLVATALGCLAPERATDAVKACLVSLIGDSQGLPTRIAVAHAMFRLRCLPTDAVESVCCLLFDADPHARKVALLAFTPFARIAATAIAGRVASTAPEQWTSEALFALARSAVDDATARRTVEGFVMRSLAGTQLLPTGIAGYAALAQLNPQGTAIPALVQVASNTDDAEQSCAALEALADLGEIARPVAKRIGELLTATDDPAREELLCRTLVRLRPSHREVPVVRVLQRVASAPDRGAAAHCMLLCLHPKEFVQAAAVVRQRFSAAAEALKQVLSQTHKVLTGIELADNDPAKGS